MAETSSGGKDLLARFDLDDKKVFKTLGETFSQADDGELYLQSGQSEVLIFDDGRIKSASFDITEGFGLRAVNGEAVAFAHSNQKGHNALNHASQIVREITKQGSGVIAPSPEKLNRKSLYLANNPIAELAFAAKVNLLNQIDNYIRQKSPLVSQVSATISSSFSEIGVLRADDFAAFDTRPIIRINISVIVKKANRTEGGSCGYGGRVGFDDLFVFKSWQEIADEALRKALLNLSSIPAPAGEMPVVLDAGWSGVLLHEAVGHGLEGDFNRKETSVFSNLIGQKVAAKGVTVVDDGTITGKRGSINIDDEGTPSSRNILIEDGILKGYMMDRMNGIQEVRGSIPLSSTIFSKGFRVFILKLFFLGVTLGLPFEKN